MAALTALLGANQIEILITRIQFKPGKPHGISLAQMSVMRRPDLKVIFTALPEFKEEAVGLGLFMPIPVTVHALVETVKRLTERAPSDQRQRLANE